MKPDARPPGVRDPLLPGPPVFGQVITFVDAIRARLLRRVMSVSVVWVGVTAGVLWLLAWMMTSRTGPPPGGTAVPLFIDGLLLCAAGAGWWVHRRSRVEWLVERRVTGSIETACGIPSGTLLSSVELARSVPDGVSVRLAQVAARDVLGQLHSARQNPEGSLGATIERWSRRGRGVVALLSPLLVAAALLSPDRSRTASLGLAHPLAAWSGPTLTALTLSPAGAEIMRGADVPLTIGAQARRTVTLRWQARGDVARFQELTVTEGAAAHVLREVRTITEFWVEAPDGARTEHFVLTPVDPLLVTELRVTLEFPLHTGRFPEEYRDVVPPLNIPVGTRIHLDGRASRALAKARLVHEEGRAISLAITSGKFSADWRPERSGTFAWEFEDLDGVTPELRPEPLVISLVSDGFPRISILMPGRDTVLSASHRQPLVLAVGDDYGVDRIELVVYRVSALGERGESVVQALEIGAARSALVRPVMDFTQWNLLSGDTVRYFARAVDNAPSPNVSTTPEFVLRPPTRSELRREVGDRLREVTTQLEELAEEAAQQAEAMRDLERESAARPPERRSQRADSGRRAEFDDREKVRRALEEQEALFMEVDSLASEIERLQSEMGDLADPALRRALEELLKLMDELAPEDLQERVQEMAQELDAMGRREMDGAFQELAQNREALRDRIEEALKRFKRAALEQEFRATGQEAEALAQQEEALAVAMGESGDGDEGAGEREVFRAQQQASLEERAEALQERLEKLMDQLSETGDLRSAAAVENAAQLGERARRDMRSAREHARAGEMPKAAESASAAAEKMEEVAQQLQAAQQQMNDQMLDALEKALRQISNDALALARQQTELRERMRGASQETLAALRGDEVAIHRGVENMAENLAVMDRITQNDGREIARQMGQAMQALEQTIAALGDQRGRAPSPYRAAETAVQGLNQVAMTAMQNAQQLGQSGDGQSGVEQMMEQLEQLAQQQAQLNEQTGEIVPMQMGEQARQQQMEDISQSQQEVADQLGEISRESGPEGPSLGDMDHMAKEAAALAELLAGGRLDSELRNRQQRLFHRLLDAGRGLEKEEESEKRESRTPGEFERGAVLPLSADDLGAFRYPLPSAADLSVLSPAERLMVIQYFERLNREVLRRSGGVP